MNRIFALILMVTLILIHIGCGGSTLGESGILTSTDPVGEAVTDAWTVYNRGSYKSAKSKFESILKLSPSAAQSSASYAGIGFAVAKDHGLIDAYPYFEKAGDGCKDAMVGMAGYYLSLADKRFFYKGIQLLERLGVQNEDKVFVPQYNKDLNDMSVHALLGLLYYYEGRYSEAYKQLKRAQVLNEPMPQLDIRSVTDSFLQSLDGAVGSDGKVYY